MVSPTYCLMRKETFMSGNLEMKGCLIKVIWEMQG
jgi:hypothetical protein